MKQKIKNSNDTSTIYKTILSYCLKSKKNTERKNPKIVRKKQGKIMLLSKYVIVRNRILLHNKKLLDY